MPPLFPDVWDLVAPPDAEFDQRPTEPVIPVSPLALYSIVVYAAES